MGGFVHLHVHSEYSLLESACRVADIPKAAKRAGQDAVALTDHANLYGAAAFCKACLAEGIKPIIGCEINVPDDGPGGTGKGYSHLTLLVKNREGWRNLSRIVSVSSSENGTPEPVVSEELLARNSGGLICLSGCVRGKIPSLVLANDLDGLKATAERYDGMFGHGNFFLELQDHGTAEEKTVNRWLAELSAAYGIPLAATNDVHYIERDDSRLRDVLLAIRENRPLPDGQDGERLPGTFDTDEYYFKSSEEMEDLFSGFDGAVENTARIAGMCDFTFDFGNLTLPRFVPDGGESAPDCLRRLAFEGLEAREKKGETDYARHTREEYAERAEHELSVIDRMGYSEYYLIVRDFVTNSKKAGIPVGPGRGSGASSLVAYLTGITDIDPVRFGLLFERFLDPERKSMPDFDIDFAHDRRDDAVRYVTEKYGHDHVAGIISFGTLAMRAALKNVGKALSVPQDVVARVTEAAESAEDSDGTISGAVERSVVLKDLMASDGIRRFVMLAAKAEGMPDYPSTHPAGIVITPEPVGEYVPLTSVSGVTVTQFDMDTVADLGLLKFDFLALRSLTAADRAEKEIRKKVPGFDLGRIPLDDRAVYAMLSAGDTDGVFQLESQGMRKMLTQLRPDRIEDIIAAEALFRPGPSNQIRQFTDAKRSGRIAEYPSPILKPILDPTFGCVLYQEQVMLIFRNVAGYTLGHAYLVIKAISKKKKEVIEGEKAEFIRGSVANGMREADAEKLFEFILRFAGYAFNKAHSAAYAVLSYRMAYMKAHWPAEFFSALLSSVQGNPDKTSQYVQDCLKRGVKILPPDINRSSPDFTSEDGGIRYGLSAVRGIGPRLAEEIARIRASSGGSFSGIGECVERLGEAGVTERQLDALIKSGALDALGIYRSRLLSSFDALMDRARNGISGQIGMFDSGGEEKDADRGGTAFPEIPELSEEKMALYEKESLGISLTEMTARARPVRSQERASDSGAGRAVSKIFLRVPGEDSREFRRARSFCSIFPGSVPVIFYSSGSGEYMREAYTLKPGEFQLRELKEMLGEENVVVRYAK